ncbi:hypothetical protein PRUB_a3445 [Pseudoalteromonas rubra]|uniref:Uncharacterized protein n=1 Tax=Pseudoalteromonas rubra TaxID=43658 RepID=A0A8T0C324_9GAMM|nr:hypothetical protein PRUB_a3445 [Pseudoalteromonas rubra]
MLTDTKIPAWYNLPSIFLAAPLPSVRSFGSPAASYVESERV